MDLGFVWFAIIPILIVAFYLAYFLSYRLGNVLSQRLGRWNLHPERRLLPSAIVAVLFAGVAWILTNNHMLSVQPEAWPVAGQWKQNRLAVTPALTVPRYAHNLGGALVVTGLWIAAAGWWRRWRGVDPPEISAIIVRTGLWTAYPLIVAAALLGPVFLFSLPAEVRDALFRPHAYSVLWWLGLAAVAAQLALGFLALRQPQEFRWFGGLTAGVAVTLVGMLCGREQVRLAFLGREWIGFSLSAWAVHPQVSSLVLFAVLLVVALAASAWLLWISVRAPGAPLTLRSVGEPRPGA